MDRFAKDAMELMDLPEEILEIIFDYLTVSDLKIASLVCLQWSNLAFSGRKMHRVRLNVDYRIHDDIDYLTLFRGSKRQYRHVVLQIGSKKFPATSCFIELLENFKRSVKSLKLVSDYLEYSQTRDILRHSRDSYFLRFCEINFPELLEIDFYSDDEQIDDDAAVRTISTFFARLKRLQVATLRSNITQPIMNALMENCRDITCLRMRTSYLENRAFSGLANLTKLKVLTLDGLLISEVFEDCKPLPALQELCLHSLDMYDKLECFKQLSTMMPNLRKLNLIEQNMVDDCLHYICKNMVSLQQMVLEMCHNITKDGFEYLNRLPHLFELSLECLNHLQGFLILIPPNQVKLLSLILCDTLTDDDLLVIPHVFPSLTRLKISLCHLITFAGIERLRSQMPWCTVITEHILE